MKRFSIVFLTILVLTSFIPSPIAKTPSFVKGNDVWVDSIMNKLTPEERIAQLFMVAAYSNKSESHVNTIKKLVRDYKIGGLIFFQGGPLRQANLTNQYQLLADVPLMVSIDAEWGLAMRLDSTTRFPRQMTLGAIQNDTLVYKMGAEIARQCKRLGMHVNLAPVVDVNNNPKNPVIGNRSFGENKYNVAKKSLMYMNGLQDNGVMANAKHFPGHGDTDSDSHKTLPTVIASRERLDSLELYPFKYLMKHGLSSVMVAHLFIPSLDTTENQASTLTKSIVTGMLKEELGFQGLIFTDALNMKGVSKFYKPGEVDLKALLAGNDVLLFSEDVPTAITQIKNAILKGEISQAEVDKRCKKILLAKKWVGLDKVKAVETTNLHEDLNADRADVLNRQLVQASITVLKNKNNILPLKRLDTLKIASLSLGRAAQTTFQFHLSKYAPVKHFYIDKNATLGELIEMRKRLAKYNLVIVQVTKTSSKPYKNFGLTEGGVALLNDLIKQQKVIINVGESPYILEKLRGAETAEAVVMSYQYTKYSQQYAAEAIFGGVGASGKLPITANKFFKEGDGVTTKPTRLSYTSPESMGINAEELLKIDSIAHESIKKKVFPGCQILVAHHGKVFYQKSFGFHTYDSIQFVQNSDLYDIASLTKVVATTASIMKMVDDKQFSLSARLSDYLPSVIGTDKSDISVMEMLAHQSGLRSWIPFWMKTVKEGNFVPGIYSTKPSVEYPLRVANQLYIKQAYTDSIYQYILDSKMRPSGNYRYSDLGYYFLNRIIRKVTYLPEDLYVKKYFYAPLGLTTMGYLPRYRFDLERIVPTELDALFRKQLVHGDVHDPGAAMCGGVGGHAGVFSNANDVAVMMQLFLNNGEYGGERYIDSSTVSYFTRRHFGDSNRRGLGFDKPADDPERSPVAECASVSSFGHTGFTGTLAWADPEKDLVYVFLSNRVHPSAEVNYLARYGIRTSIQEVIDEAIKGE